ncbi:MAG TPA: o-succinylbenzoate--CoA ligase [Chloroflexota bacterium]
MAPLVPDWLRQRASLTPSRAALNDFTFAELDQHVDSACAVLRDLGVEPGQHVGLRAPNCIGFVVAVHALMRLGAVLVPINTRLTPAEVEWQRSDANLALVIEDIDALLEPRQTTPVPREFDLEATHSIVYTSGTSGTPKGAILTYGNHWWSAVASAMNLGTLPTDRWLACLPLFHVGGLAILLRGVIYGTHVVLHDRFDPHPVNQAIDQGVTHVSVVSTMLQRMLDHRAGHSYPGTLRCVLLGGGPAPLPLLERALAAGAPVFQSYGLTETASQVATLAPEDIQRKLGSAGKPLMGTQLRIVDGEIQVRGPVVSPGYLHQRTDGEWLRTGDLGYLDDEGYLYVQDRRSDLIVSGGENVYPAEVEAALLAHPAVEDAGVFGVADAEWGQTVAAALVLREPASADDILAFCRRRLAGYKLPKRLEFVEVLPRNAAGKLLRRELRQ